MTIPTFPPLPGVSWPVGRSPMWSTDKQVTVSGRVTTLQYFSYPRYKYELTFDVLRSDSNLEWQTLVAFYNRVGGGALLFQFNDTDNTSVTDQALGTGDGTTTAFQLVRTMTGTGANVFVEPVWVPIGTPVVKINGTPTVLFTLGATGLITFNTPPANGALLTWTGTYNWPCRFDDDTASFQKLMTNFWDLKKISFTTEKL